MNSILKQMITLAIVFFAVQNCGKKNKNDPSSGDSMSAVDSVDGRLFGTWLILEEPFTNDNGEEIPDLKSRLLITIAKDKLTVANEIVKAGAVVCKAEESTSQFAVSKDKIIVNEVLSKVSSKNVEEIHCQVSLAKTSLSYSIESNDVLSLKPDRGGDNVNAKRVK